MLFFYLGGRVGGGCEQRIEVFVKIHKNYFFLGGGGFFFWGGGGRVGGVRVDVNEEMKFSRKLKKNLVGGGGLCWAVVKLGGGGGGQCGCERMIEVFVKIQKKKIGGGGGWGGVGGSRWM